MMCFGTPEREDVRGRQRRQLLDALLCWLHAVVLAQAVNAVDACVMDPFLPFQVDLKPVQFCMSMCKKLLLLLPR